MDMGDSINAGTPKSSISNDGLFPYKPSIFWGTPIDGNPQISPWSAITTHGYPHDIVDHLKRRLSGTQGRGQGGSTMKMRKAGEAVGWLWVSIVMVWLTMKYRDYHGDYMGLQPSILGLYGDCNGCFNGDMEVSMGINHGDIQHLGVS